MSDFLFLANDPCLDFVNTEVVLEGVRTDMLRGFADLADWLEKAGIAAHGDASRLAAKWAGTPEADRALDAARKLRGLLRSSVMMAEKRRSVPASLAGLLTDFLRTPRQRVEVVSSKGRLQTKLNWLLEKPADLLVPIAHSAANFFATADYSAIRKCEDPACILYFYDTSKNHTRRWCSMGLCGNRAKVAAFRARN